jgi:ferredoxin
VWPARVPLDGHIRRSYTTDRAVGRLDPVLLVPSPRAISRQNEFMSRINVDLSLCQGHGRCYGVAPKLFRPIDDDGHAEFYPVDIDQSDLELGERAVVSCPEQALSWDHDASV